MTERDRPTDAIHDTVDEILRLADQARRAAPTGAHPAREGLDRERPSDAEPLLLAARQ